jgi:hypothetical protein
MIIPLLEDTKNKIEYNACIDTKKKIRNHHYNQIKHITTPYYTEVPSIESVAGAEELLSASGVRAGDCRAEINFSITVCDVLR